LIANDLVSVQPMSLPSGLIFFLDFRHETGRLGAGAGDSVYGGNVIGKQLTGGVNLSNLSSQVAAGGHYDLGHAYSAPTGSKATMEFEVLSGTPLSELGGSTVNDINVGNLTDAQKKALRFDADLLETTRNVAVFQSKNNIATDMGQLDEGALAGVTFAPASGSAVLIRRLTRVIDNKLIIAVTAVSGADGTSGWSNAVSGNVTFPIKDSIGAGNAVGAVIGSDTWGLEEPKPATRGNEGSGVGKSEIPEIDIKVDSIAVTAQTRKLKAKWSPELGQDLNAYHNLDAEVELTGILSEQIALEIDRELLSELVNGATAGTRYWSRAPGLFVDSTGAEVGANTAAPDFTGTVSEWYETLIETINDVSAQIHRKTLRGGANFVVCSPEVANILEFTSGFRAAVTADQDRGTIGAVRAGSLSKKFDVYVDPYFMRNVVLVGRKGSSFLESGFVYAPYVPLQVTPTIFGTEDFVPRKGVMTRYAKKMVRPDMYGLVIVRGLLGESGA
jgi:hypothetical protein